MAVDSGKTPSPNVRRMLIAGIAFVGGGFGLILLKPALVYAPLPRFLHFPCLFLFLAITVAVPVWKFLVLAWPLVFLYSLVSRDNRRWAAWFLIVALLGWCVWASAPSLARKIERVGAAAIARRGKPLIAAIERHREDNGQYPRKLAELVPDYLDVIPYTGAVVCPVYHYDLPDPEKSRHSILPETDYQVRVNTFGADLMDMSYLLYRPGGDYPYGKPIADGWAYAED